MGFGISRIVSVKLTKPEEQRELPLIDRTEEKEIVEELEVESLEVYQDQYPILNDDLPDDLEIKEQEEQLLENDIPEPDDRAL